MIWVVFAVITALVLLVLLRPLLRAGRDAAPRAAYDLVIYRDQLAEIDRDVARGILSEIEAAAARLEIERRMLALAPPNAAPMPADGRTLRAAPDLALLLVLLVPLLALGLYKMLGNPDQPDRPLAVRGVEPRLLADDGTLDMAKVRAMLQQRLARTPASLQGWLLLARTDERMQDWSGARDAWQHALALGHDRPDLLGGYGDMLVAAARGMVTPEASALFQRAVAADRGDYRARYYLALGKAQHGDMAGALAGWQAMAHDAPPGAPWLRQLRETIAAAQQAQRGNAEPGPDAGVQTDAGAEAAIMSLPADQRAEAIAGMVEGLHARLQADPRDIEGWRRLARSYLVLNQPDKAADAFAHVSLLNPKDVDALIGRADALRAAGPGKTALPPEAMVLYARAHSLDPKRPEALWFLGVAAARAHDAKTAAGYWTALLAQLPPGSGDYRAVARALNSLGRS